MAIYTEPGTSAATRMVCAECGETANSIEYGKDFGQFVSPCGHSASVKFIPND